MNDTIQRLQFGDNLKPVPGHETDLSQGNDPAELEKYLVDPDKYIWDLAFSFRSPAQPPTMGFYLPNMNVPGNEGALIKSWYWREVDGPPSEKHALTIIPFSADGQFLQASHVVDFSEPSSADDSIDTDAIVNATVTATAHFELPEYAKGSTTNKSTSHSIIITTESTKMVFDHYFVLWGPNSMMENDLTVEKGQSCLALAVYREETSTTTREVSTDMRERISHLEWPQIIAQVVKGVIVEGNGEIWQYLSSGVLAGMGPELLRQGVEEISMHITQLEKVKSVVAGLAERR